jgi:hypothetical protein
MTLSLLARGLYDVVGVLGGLAGEGLFLGLTGRGDGLAGDGDFVTGESDSLACGEIVVLARGEGVGLTLVETFLTGCGVGLKIFLTISKNFVNIRDSRKMLTLFRSPFFDN